MVESLLSGIIPAAMVRTDAGKTRRVRSVDLERVAAESSFRPFRGAARRRTATCGRCRFPP